MADLATYPSGRDTWPRRVSDGTKSFISTSVTSFSMLSVHDLRAVRPEALPPRQVGPSPSRGGTEPVDASQCRVGTPVAV